LELEEEVDKSSPFRYEHSGRKMKSKMSEIMKLKIKERMGGRDDDVKTASTESVFTSSCFTYKALSRKGGEEEGGR
jgi:hypothetical protein